MQVNERALDARRRGELFGSRNVTVFFKNDHVNPIQLHNANILIDHAARSATLRFPRKPNTKEWKGNNPAEQARFTAGIQSGSRLSMLVHPNHNLKPVLWRAGWLTSAYLYAFYTFGYRLILHPAFEGVRKVILDSFAVDRQENPDFPDSQYIKVIACGVHNVLDPHITLALPIDTNEFAHIEVDFLNYHVKLPFIADEDIFWPIVLDEIPDFWEMIDKWKQDGNRPKLEVHCTKTKFHDCIWDFVLGRQIGDTNIQSI